MCDVAVWWCVCDVAVCGVCVCGVCACACEKTPDSSSSFLSPALQTSAQLHRASSSPDAETVMDYSPFAWKRKHLTGAARFVCISKARSDGTMSHTSSPGAQKPAKTTCFSS